MYDLSLNYKIFESLIWLPMKSSSRKFEAKNQIGLLYTVFSMKSSPSQPDSSFVTLPSSIAGVMFVEEEANGPIGGALTDDGDSDNVEFPDGWIDIVLLSG